MNSLFLKFDSYTRKNNKGMELFSERGRKKLQANGFLYVFDKNSADKVRNPFMCSQQVLFFSS